MFRINSTVYKSAASVRWMPKFKHHTLTLSFFDWSSKNSIFCSTKLQAYKYILKTAPHIHMIKPTLRSKDPTHTWNGFFKYCSERRRTPSGQVALNLKQEGTEVNIQNAGSAKTSRSYLVITVCLSGRISSKIFFI